MDFWELTGTGYQRPLPLAMALATHGTFLAGSQNAPGKFHGLQVELGLSASIDFVPPIVRSRTERWDWKGTSKRPDTSEHAYKDQGTNVVKRKAVQPIIPTFTCTPPPGIFSPFVGWLTK
jgi:hypothetical protein